MQITAFDIIITYLKLLWCQVSFHTGWKISHKQLMLNVNSIHLDLLIAYLTVSYKYKTLINLRKTQLQNVINIYSVLNTICQEGVR